MPPRPPSSAKYPQPTQTAFAQALASLAKSLPQHHAELTALVEQGRIHDASAVIAVLQGSPR